MSILSRLFGKRKTSQTLSSTAAEAEITESKANGPCIVSVDSPTQSPDPRAKNPRSSPVTDESQSKPLTHAATLTGHLGPISGMEFAPNTSILVSAGNDATVRFWKIPEGKRLAELSGHPNAIQCLAISGNGEVVATGGSTSRGSRESIPSEPTCFVWRVSQPSLRHSLKGAVVPKIWTVC